MRSEWRGTAEGRGELRDFDRFLQVLSGLLGTPPFHLAAQYREHLLALTHFDTILTPYFAFFGGSAVFLNGTTVKALKDMFRFCQNILGDFPIPFKGSIVHA